ncbi:MAG: sigma-70 family RNA polymerase sigma factor [Planctomycetota bacterium]
MIQRSQDRLHRLARKMLRCDPRVARWEQTDDLLQASLVRLHRSLDSVQPATVQAFIGLAATHMRRELTDLARHHFGPHGDAKHHFSDGDRENDGSGHPLHEPASPGDGPSTLAEWETFHEKVKELIAEEREVFDFVYYQELSQEETAICLGVNERTIQRRWRSAKLNLAKLMRGEMPNL